jgi:hypothetical protein
MTQTKKKRGSRHRKSRKNIQGGRPSPQERDTKYSTTMIKNAGPPPKPPKTNSYSSICNEISNQTNKVTSSSKARL